MSQSSAAFSGPLTTDQDPFTQDQLDQLLNTVRYDQIAYTTQNPPHAAGDLSLQRYCTPPGSVAATPAPNSDSSDYNFHFGGRYSTGYPTPGPNTPHPYPFEQQRCLDLTQDVSFATHQRPPLIHAQTNASYLHPVPTYARRRSLSHSAIDHTPALTPHAPNPVFVRLQTPRARSESPGPHANRRRGGRHSRSTSHDAHGRDHQSREQIPTSVPYHVNGLVPTRIGDPISPKESRYHQPATKQQWSVQDGYAGDIVFRHMPPEQMERSRRIIEIGSIAVSRHVDPTLEQGATAMTRKIEEVERYLRAERGECHAALRGCATIRKALMRNEYKLLVRPTVDAFQDTSVDADTLDAPSKTEYEAVDNLFGDNGNNAEAFSLTDMIMEENATSFSNGNI